MSTLNTMTYSVAPQKAEEKEVNADEQSRVTYIYELVEILWSGSGGFMGLCNFPNSAANVMPSSQNRQ